MSLMFIGVMILFAGALTAAIVYNTVATNVFERRSEIASLRALGVTLRETVAMLTIENLASSAIGLAVGLPLGALAARGITELYQSETISIVFHVAPRSYIFATLFTLALVLVCQLPALRGLRRMNLAQMTRLHGE